MVKKYLITYTSYTGSTEKVALRYKETYEKQGWHSKCVKTRTIFSDLLMTGEKDST
jgi:flavodoxin